MTSGKRNIYEREGRRSGSSTRAQKSPDSWGTGAVGLAVLLLGQPVFAIYRCFEHHIF